MKEFYKFCQAAFFCLAFFLATPHPVLSQTNQRVQTARSNVIVDSFVHGFYESLPPVYQPGIKYPLLVFLHGQGEVGDGSAASLPKVLANGPPRQINAHTFPDLVTVNGQSYGFIVISPQLNTNPWPGYEQLAVNDVIQYAIDHYQVDTSRIYLTGLSMGGGIAWEYAGWPNYDYVKRLAGLLVIAGASWPDQGRANEMARFHLPVWATANDNDPTVPSWYTVDYVQNLNTAGANPPPLINIFPGSTHGGWDTTYNALKSPAGLSVYQWMLQYQRVGNNVIVSGGGVLPVIVIDYKAAVSGTSAVTVSWATTMEQNNRYFILQRSQDGQRFSDLDTITAYNKPHSYSYTDESPFGGSNFYRLLQVDLDEKGRYTTVLEVSVPGDGQVAFRLSPNPTSDIINMELTNTETGMLQVNITDAEGKVLRTQSFRKEGQQWAQGINVSDLPSGNYFISVWGQKTREALQFIKN